MIPVEITRIECKNNCTIPESYQIMENLLEIIKDTLAFGEDVLISNFGKFCVKQKDDRKSRNPATGENLMLEPRKIVKFNCSWKLRDRINGN
jgi:integration host factor subunit alpha